MRFLITSFFTLSLFFFSCSNNDDDTKGENSSLTQTLEHDGETREYVLYVPETYDGTSQVPVMLNFHGFGGTATSHMNTADMRSLADSENFILVYPQGTLLDGFPHWNSGLDTPENKSDADDLGFISSLINELSTNYNINNERIYACGYSNGSFFSYALACYLSETIASIGSVSGSMPTETVENCSPTHPVPVINLHGTSDGTVPYNGGEGLSSINDMINYWIGFNNTNSTPIENTVSSNGTTIESYIYTEGDADVSIEHYKIINGNHVWFNINYEGANTNELIWNFVSKYDINGLIE